MASDKANIAKATPAEIRNAIRTGQVSSQTSGMAAGYAQGNLVVLQKEWANDFLQFCANNPKPCPLLAVSKVGDPALPDAGTNIDIRSDLPSYRVFVDGELVDEVNDIRELWQDDFVAFLIGCSFSFEWALMNEGIGVRHIELGRNVPMYRTNIECKPAGAFKGQYVASMRPMKPSDAIRAIEITSRMPQVHGSPIHFGDPAAIGVADLSRPDYGDAVPLGEGEVPVFWACGVTPQVALANAKPPIAITHSPGYMLITDIPDQDLLTGKFNFVPPLLG